MTALEIFTYSNQTIRTVVVDSEPWFVAADITGVLGYGGGARNAVARLPERMKGVEEINTPGGAQRMTVVSESGAYRLAMRSNLPEAERFQDWIAEDVVPSLRQTGIYSVAPTAAQFAIPQTYSEALRLAADEIEKNAALTAQLAIAAPKVAYVDTFAGDEDGTTVRMLAAQLCISEPKLRAYLIERKVLSRRTVYDFVGRDGKRRIEYEWQARVGYYGWFKAKDHLDAPRMYNGQLRSTLYVTPLGKVGIAGLLSKHPLEVGAA